MIEQHARDREHAPRTIAPSLIEHGVPVPESRLLDGDLPLPRGAAETPLYSACWVKQASEHKTREGDVRFATDADSVQDALDRLRARGLTRAIVQRHVEGDMVKFYGVGGFDSVGGGSSGASWFRWFYPKEHPVEGHRLRPLRAARHRVPGRGGARARGLGRRRDRDAAG